MNNLILDALEQTAARLPEKIAFADEQTEVSFSALVRRAQSVAAALIPLVPPRSVVGFYMDKGVETVVGFMGAVYAGCAYAQLNLRHPAPRVRAMLETLDTPIVVTDRAHLAQLEGIEPPARILLIEELEETPPDAPALAAVRAQMIDADPLYVNFTSGSTGTPKGVVVCHRNVCEFIPCFAETFAITEKDVLANQAPFDFDVSVKDIYSSLFTGARVEIVPTAYFTNPTKLMDFLCDRGVTLMVWAVSALCFLTTMNALAYNPRTGLVDVCGGAEDIARGVVRCVGESDRRFQEDGLRILRALRFASVLGFQIAPETAAAIHRNRALLQYLAAERVQSELTKLLCGQNVGAVLREFADVLAVPIPELRPMFGFEQHNPHHDRDVWLHTAAVVEHIPPEPVLRWAALLHDVGKPPCFSLGPDGVGHFYGHAAKSTELAEGILTRLRFDTAGRTRITQLIRYHDLPIAPEAKPIRRLMNKLGVETVRQLFELHIADACGQSAICAGRVETYRQAERVLDELLAADACFSLKDLAVNGDDLLALGLRGRAVGAALQACLDAVMDETLPNDRAALLGYAAENLQRFANS